MSDSEVVRISQRGPALWARISRPHKGNACSSEVMAGLHTWMDGADDPDVRVLVLTGSGSSFCAGADLAEASALLGDPDGLMGFLDRGRDTVRRLRAVSAPTIAAVNGAAFAGGLELLLACDIAIAAASARVGDRHLAAGQVPGWGSSAMLPAAIGPARARRLLLTGEAWSAAGAERHGLVSEVVDSHDLDGRAQELAEQLAAYDPTALARMLQVARPVSASEETLWAREHEVLRAHALSQQAVDTHPTPDS
ncbi:MAG: enoyl-CoA hydratase/isomerase family protein [Nocardioidaceae bacterium]